ncbi:hypothetical protein MBRU_16490 [Mycolicibacterium brumae DSM 44177]|nr:hypothetical protein MBRU_16490 [Mycolicibacterium brumae DSM 44177]
MIGPLTPDSPVDGDSVSTGLIMLDTCGLLVPQTLHLVADNAKRYKMF